MKTQHTGIKSSCGMNIERLAHHETALEAVNKRLDRIERNHELIEQAHKELSAKIGEVREKLFNGYDTKITTTNERVNEIIAMLKDLSDRGGPDELHIESIIDRKLNERENSRKSDVRWLKRHRIELLSIFVALCMLAMVILTYFKG